MASILKVDQIKNTAASGNIQIPTGYKLVAVDSGAIVAPGHVIQVVQSTLTSTPISTSTSFADTGLSVTITPKSASSKILVQADYGTGSSASAGGLIIQLLRESTVLFYRGASYDASAATYGADGFSHLDSPATTSSITYKVQYKTQSASSTVYLNPAFSDYPNPTAHITAMEIAQ